MGGIIYIYIRCMLFTLYTRSDIQYKIIIKKKAGKNEILNILHYFNAKGWLERKLNLVNQVTVLELAAASLLNNASKKNSVIHTMH